MAVRARDLYPDGEPPDGTLDRARGSRVESARVVRQEQNHRFRRYLRRASLSSFVPGLGLILGGRRVLGWLVLLSILALVAGVVWLATGLSRPEIVGLAVDPAFLRAAATGLAVLAVLLLVSAAASHHLLQPPGIRRSQRVLGATVMVLVTSLVVAPVALASRYAMVQHALVTSVFTAADDAESPPAGSEPAEGDPARSADPWKGVERVNILLMGSDAGPDREGTRPDTNVVASVDPATGDAVLFSLPRNLENVPFPSSSPLSEDYPFGWQGEPGDVGSQLLNAVYRYVPSAHPEEFTGVDDPGAEAMKLAAEGITGLPIDYYVMVDLDGFQQAVDALGGIDLTIRQRIPLESSMLPSGYCSPPTGYLEPGRQRLNGYQALWYARVRCGGEGLTDDYDRMRRQRCVLGAMIERADPLTLLRRYESLAGATQRIVSTDIPSSMVPAFAELALRVQGSPLRTLPFTDKVIDPADPDYYEIRQQVEAALEPPEPQPVDAGASQPGAGAEEPTVPTPTEPPTATDDGSGGSGVPSAPDETSGVLELDEVC